MYKILLTDDEQIVIDALSFIINKNFEGQVKVFTALSGTEAIEISTKEDIDIIFMDINMPGLSGLDTVSCITKLKPDTVIIMLSAFDRFQYAQEAMNLGAFKYITKPVNRNVVIQTIRSAMDLIDSRNGNSSTDQELNKKLDFISPMIENDFIYSCVFNKDKNVDINSFIEYFNLSESDFYILCLEFPKIDSSNQNEVLNKIRETLSPVSRCLLSSFTLNRMIALLPVPKDSAADKKLQTINKIHNTLVYNYSSSIKMAVSSLLNSPDDFNAAYNQTVSVLNNIDSTGGISFFTEHKESSAAIAESGSPNNDEFKRQILLHIRQGDSTGTKNFALLYLSSLFSAEDAGQNLNQIKNQIFELIITAKNCTLEYVKNFDSENFNKVFEFLTSQNDSEMIKDFVQSLLMECSSAVAGLKSQAENPIIKKVCDFVNQNLDKDISLDQMADYANVSSFYLSKLFKEEKGVTFVNFISDLRLEKAKELLKNPELSIKEITISVGYNDQNYLSRIFKNRYGLSPSEFRNTL